MPGEALKASWYHGYFVPDFRRLPSFLGKIRRFVTLCIHQI